MESNGKFHQYWDIPLWLALKGSGLGKSSKESRIMTILENGFAKKVYPSRYMWMELLAYRVVRRYKILAADSYELVRAIMKRYRHNRTFMERIPDGDLAIGFLVPNDSLEMVSATAESTPMNPSPVVAEAARYRMAKLKSLSRKMNQLDSETRQAMILAWETSFLLGRKENDAKIKQKTRGAIALEQWRLGNEQS